MAQESKRGLKIPQKPAKKAPKGRNYLMVIGINAYQHFTPLNNAVGDAKAIKELLVARYQFQEEDVMELYDQQATRKNILRGLRSLEDQITTEDNLIVYFAGHGTMNKRKTKGFWIPVDAESHQDEYIANSRIKDHLDEVEAHHIYLIVDSCFSGSIVNRSSAFSERVETLPSRRVLTSGRNEVVSDGKPGKHSPFANCLITYLRTHQGSLPASELELHVKKNTSRSASQSPDSAYIYGLGDQGGEFVFHPKQDEENEWQMAEVIGTFDGVEQYPKADPEGRDAALAEEKLAILKDETAWQQAQKTNNLTAYRVYLRDFPEGIHHEEAHQQMLTIEETADWWKAKQRDNVTTYKEFLVDYPESGYVVEAEARIRVLLASEKASAVAKSQAKTQQASPPKVVLAKKITEGPIEMVWIEGGTFMMGSPEGEEGRYNIEIQHEVTVSSFAIGKYPVTQKEWNEVMGENPSYFKGGDDWPVEQVSWYDVQEFILKLNQQTGKVYRMPTEAEWEFAARGGNLSKGYIYAGSNLLEDVGWFKGNAGKKTHPVGQKAANELGLYDMSGNVREWCEDWFAFYSTEKLTDPKVSNTGGETVIRGGGWNNLPQDCRSSNRDFGPPYDPIEDLGFRLALSPSQEVVQ